MTTIIIDYEIEQTNRNISGSYKVLIDVFYQNSNKKMFW